MSSIALSLNKVPSFHRRSAPVKGSVGPCCMGRSQAREGHLVNALAQRGDERRGTLR